MGSSAPSPKTPVKITAGPKSGRMTVFEWYELQLLKSGAAGAGQAALYAERVFFLPDIDATIPIKEGPPPADWTGYHTAKHGIYERFMNLKGEEVRLSRLLYNEEYRWVRSEWLENPNQLKALTEPQINNLMQRAFGKAPLESESSIGPIPTT